MRFRPVRYAIIHALILQPVLGMRLVAAQEPVMPPPTDVPTFTVGTAAVTVDVVVRDKKGRAVRDLHAEDFEVYEDDVKQKIDSFQVFGHDQPEPAARAATPEPAAPSSAPVAAPTPAEPVGEVRSQVIAFLFDRLSAEARNMAQKSALTYLDKGHTEGDLVGVFSIDLALRAVQPFTTDRVLIRAGLERAASQANTEFANTRGQSRELVDIISGSERAADSVTGATGGPGATPDQGVAGAAAVSGAVANRELTMARAFEGLERDQQGFATTNGLLAVVEGLKRLPGRKTVVFFSEGMAIPSNVQARFKDVIHSANRANVSVYSMDAGGLRTESTREETRKEMLQAAERRMQQLESGRDDGTGGSMMRALERNENLLRLDPESGLGQLANETGGFLIRDTNDASAAFRRIEEDMRFHYLVSYSPSNENYDGKFRTISVKVRRPSLQVQTRQGYFAVRSVESAPLKAFEAPALALLDRPSRPHAFPIQTIALSFPTLQKPGRTPVLVHVPGSAVSYVLDKDDKSPKKMHRGDFTVVVRLRDASGREVDRLSQHYPMIVSADKLEDARRGDILFYREAELRPGRHTVEAVGYDALSQKASVTTTVLEVPHTQEGRPRLSSVVVVGHAEKLAAGDQQVDHPLYYGETLLVPNMGDPIRKSVSPAVGFFFTVYGVKEGTGSRKAMIEVYKGETAAGQVTAELPAPDASGRIQYAGALPLQGFGAGSYTLKVTATTGSGFDSKQASFTVAE